MVLKVAIDMSPRPGSEFSGHGTSDVSTTIWVATFRSTSWLQLGVFKYWTRGGGTVDRRELVGRSGFLILLEVYA